MDASSHTPEISAKSTELCSYGVKCLFYHVCTTGGGPIGVHKHYPKGSIINIGLNEDPYLSAVCSGIGEFFNLDENGGETVYGLLSKGLGFGKTDLLVSFNYIERIGVVNYLFVRALTDMELCELNVGQLEQRIKDSPELNKAIINWTYAFINFTALYIGVLTTRPMHLRVKKMLALLCEFDQPGNGSTTLPITQNDLAHMLGVDRITVTRILNKLEKEGYLKLGNRKMTIISKPQTGDTNVVHLDQANEGLLYD